MTTVAATAAAANDGWMPKPSASGTPTEGTRR